MPIGHAILHLVSELDHTVDPAAFARWCDDHHREILTVPGFLRARRFEQLSAPAGHHLLTLYDLADARVLTSEAYARHGREHTPLPAELATGLHFDRSVWELAGPAGPLVGTAPGGALIADWHDADWQAAELAPVAEAAPAVVTVRRYRGGVNPHDAVTGLALIEVASAADVDDVLTALPAGGTGTREAYRQVFLASA